MQDQSSNFMADNTYSADELGTYCSLSAMAVVALVVGLLSPLVFVSPLLLVVPLAAIGAGILALRRIASSGGGLTGAGLARAGIALAIVCGGASLTREWVRDQIFCRQADAVAERWLSALSTDSPSKAIELLTPEAVASKLKPTGISAVIAQTFDNELVAAVLRQDSLAQALTQLSVDGEIRFSRLSAIVVPGAVGPRVVMSLAAASLTATEDQAAPTPFSMILIRLNDASGKARWRVDSWQLDEAAL